MTHPKTESYQAVIDKNPFFGLVIDDTSVLDRLCGRSPCPRCGKSRKFFCYTCHVPVEALSGKLPVIKLPIKIDIIKHKQEIDGKSTASHAAILAPYDVTVYTYPDIPDYSESEKVVLIFPSANAFSIEELFTNERKPAYFPDLPKSRNCATLMTQLLGERSSFVGDFHRTLPVSRAVFVDSTWNQSRGIFKDSRIKKLPCVVLQSRISQFWRHQKGSPRWYLSTIEAIHQFLVELHINAWGLNDCYEGWRNCFNEEYSKMVLKNCVRNGDEGYKGQYDNLLFFFVHMYELIHTYYDHEQLYAYKRRLM